MHIQYQDQPPEAIVHAVGNPSLARWFWEQYKARQHREWAAAFREQEQVSIQNSKAQHRPHDGIGECVFRIGRKLRYKIAQAFGWEAATNNEFCKELVRDNKDRFCLVPVREKRAIVVKTRDLTPRVIVPKAATRTVIVPKHLT